MAKTPPRKHKDRVCPPTPRKYRYVIRRANLVPGDIIRLNGLDGFIITQRMDRLYYIPRIIH